MATAVHHTDHRATSEAVSKDQAEYIPDVIEEKRKDAEGRISITKYARGKLLGKGGFAKCFLGTLLPSNHQYALKIVAKSTLAKTRAKQKLQTEIKIHRTLRHTYVCKFERFFEDTTNCYMLLELCSNNSMSDLLKRRKRLSEPETRYYLHQLISSLKYLHENLVIHRDLKLGNLFIDSQMRIKVGDFGLATKVTDVNERKKTICGTPNYIAPEILEGKNGHSFEVDVWSTGVIMYTLLVGRPPFESKDVKSTYKRILSNSFSFPEQTPVCEHAKNLIRNILQTKPELRPTLDGITDHSFFTRGGAYTPTHLPESALKEPPVWPQSHKALSYSEGVQYGDENDPHAANHGHKKSLGDGGSRPRTAPISGVIRSSNEDLLSSKLRDSNDILKPLTTRPGAAATSSGSVNVVLPGVSTRSQVQTRDPLVLSAPLQKRERLSSTVAVPEKRSYSGKFDIYQDHKQDTKGPSKALSEHFSSSNVKTSVTAREALSLKDNEFSLSKHHHHHKGALPASVPSGVGTGVHRYDNARVPSSSGTQSHSEMEQLQSGLEYVHLDTHTKSSSGAGASRSKPVLPDQWDGARKPAEAWSEEDHNILHHFSAPVPTTTTTAFQSPPQIAVERANNRGAVVLPPATESESYPMQLGTPPDQMIAVNEYKALGTLESMHEVLSSRGLDDLLPTQGLAFENSNRPRADVKHTPSLPHHKANIWVVRYVDYTSKYGLGFLLNTGSAGVYFNDSTKIVLSPDGVVFQYIERKKKENGSSSSEHTIQTHLISRYPSELQKKVTLLRHFRNYLVDQQKEGAIRGDDGSATGGSEGMENIVISTPGDASVATDSIPFGTSSATLSNADAIMMGCTVSLGTQTDYKNPIGSDDSPKMPFLKKWVRTRHAILFRLSNRTVQVLFFDRSEVLLSSEARMVTYVNKQNVRSEHSLEEVLQTGRTDIAKRLKYAKDIMFRLITTQAR